MSPERWSVEAGTALSRSDGPGNEWREVRVSVGVFVDKTHQPLPEELTKALSGAVPLWKDLAGFLKDGCGCDGEFRFYGRNYGWALRFRKWGWALCSMYPCNGFFTAQVVLSLRLAARAAELPLSPKTRAVLDSTREYPEGRWLYLPVSSSDDVEDVRKLVSLKFKRK
jgi:Protein of unknown function (DUF3788)